ncbi:MAG TPA: S41 family peptidase [Candidatus Cybelea sp.]
MLPALMFAAAITPAQVDSTVAAAEKAFHGYVFPTAAAKAVAMLEAKEPSYRRISDPELLVKTVNADLYATTHDRHVRLDYPFDASMADTTSTPAEKEREQRLEAFGNYFFYTVRRLPGNVGYIDFRGFSGDATAARAIDATMAFLADTDALIIDLRKNHGGDPRTAEMLEAYFFAEPQQITSLMVRDPKSGHTTETQQYTAAMVPGQLYLNKSVYLLTSSNTFSCAEQFTYDLHNQKRVTIVGQTTGGGANPGGFVSLGSGFGIFIPTGRAYSPITKTNWEGSGIAPDVSTPSADALLKAYELALVQVKARVKDPEMIEAVNHAIANPEAMLQY